MNNSLLSKEHFDYIKVSVESDLATVTLDRVAKRNAFNLGMWEEIRDAFTFLDQNKLLLVPFLSNLHRPHIAL